MKSFENANKVFTQINNPDLITKKLKDKKSIMGKMMTLIKKKDELELTKVIDMIPRQDIGNWIWKLSRYKYAKYPYTIIAITKMKLRRGF